MIWRFTGFSEWVSDYNLTSNESFFQPYILSHTLYYDDNDDVRFVPDQHTYLDLYSVRSLKHQSAGRRHVAQLRHIIPIPIQPVFAIFP